MAGRGEVQLWVAITLLGCVITHSVTYGSELALYYSLLSAFYHYYLLL